MGGIKEVGEGLRENDPRAIRDRERTIAEASDTGSTIGEIAAQILELTKAEGITIVDLASGASSLVAHLLTRGNNAFGVDRLYYDRQELEVSMEKGVNYVARRYQNNGKPDHALAAIESARKFKKSLEENPDRYIAGWLTDLPLPDNFSDRTVSIHGISNLGEDAEVMLQAIREAIRITKPGGLVTIAPFHTPESSVFREFIDTHGSILELLREEGIRVSVERLEELKDMFRMNIFKTA